ncbi:MAG: cyclic nucleotide-binding domain-containing protein [Planctomycetota bacterium]
MPLTEVTVVRPQRWDVPFGDAMREEDVDQLLRVEPFNQIDANRFPKALPLRGILKNDVRVSTYQDSDIIVREGDYGNSAFLILQGQVRVVLDGLDPTTLGRQPAEQPGFWKSILSIWNNPTLPEVRPQFSSDENGVASDRSATADLAQTRVFLQDVPRLLEGAKTLSLEKGEIFGELAALTRTPRSATVLADGDALLLEIRWQGLRDLMRRTDALRQHIEQLYRQNSLRVHLRETPLLADLPAEQLAAVADAIEFETHGDFEWQAKFESTVEAAPKDAIVSEPLIAEEGTDGDGIVLVRSGFARLSHRFGHGHRTVAYLGKGQVYGVAEAIESFQSKRPAKLRASLRALGYVDVLRIPQRILERHVFPRMSDSRLAATAARQSVPIADPSSEQVGGADGAQVETDLLEFLVERRFINGPEAMVIDLDRCTRCDDCVRACAATHDNNPRFIRHGHQHGKYMIAHACMHCVDPVCMIGCPTGAIGRNQDTGIVQINDLTCIGCSTCANSCPYDNIRMTEIRDSTGAIVLDETTKQPIHKATKCDLCADQVGGPACQRACPHDALVRMDLGNLGELAQWVNR